MITVMALLLVFSICFLYRAAAQSDDYSKMAPVDQYLMERNAEILLAPTLKDERFVCVATKFPQTRCSLRTLC